MNGPNYAHCTSGTAFLICLRCGAAVCSDDTDLHDNFHATTVEIRRG